MMYAFTMKFPVFALIVCSVLMFSACRNGDPEIPSFADPGTSDLSITPTIPEALSPAALASADYTIVDSTVRSALTKAGQDFHIPVRNGSFTFPPSVLLDQFSTVSVDTNHITYGDLTGDGIPDAVVRVQSGTGEFSVSELAAFTASGKTAIQFAAFPLGHVMIKTVAITSGKIRVNFTHTVAGDPGPRNTELLLELPKK